MFFFLDKTSVSRLLQQRLKTLGITRESFRDWTRTNGFRPYEFLEAWENCRGVRVSRDPFLIRLALRMEVDPLHVLLAAAADRAPMPYRSFFLTVQDELERHPGVVQGWLAMDVQTRQAILALVSQPQEARCWVEKCRATQAQPP